MVENLKSSVLQNIDYNKNNQSLDVTFSDNTRYRYTGIDEKMYNNLKTAKSHGNYFNSNIRNKFKSVKI